MIMAELVNASSCGNSPTSCCKTSPAVDSSEISRTSSRRPVISLNRAKWRMVMVLDMNRDPGSAAKYAQESTTHIVPQSDFRNCESFVSVSHGRAALKDLGAVVLVSPGTWSEFAYSVRSGWGS